MTTALNHRYPAIQGEEEDELESEFDLPANEFETESELEAEYEFEFEAEAEAELEAEGELEDEFEAELEEEAEGFVNPVRRIYRDAELMAHLAARAADTESESEAEAFIGAAIPLMSKLIPRAASLVSGNAPSLIRGATRLVRTLRRNPQTRQLVRAVPVILQRTAQSLADQNDNGDLDPGDVLTTLGTMANRVLSGRNRSRAIRAAGVFDRRYHRRARWQRARTGGAGRRRQAGGRQLDDRRQPAAPRRGGGRPVRGQSRARRR